MQGSKTQWTVTLRFKGGEWSDKDLRYDSRTEAQQAVDDAFERGAFVTQYENEHFTDIEQYYMLNIIDSISITSPYRGTTMQ